MTDSPDPSPRHELRPTSAALLTGAFVVALVAGWLMHRITDAWVGHAPVISWGQPLLLVVIAVILAWVGWSTYRSRQSAEARIEPHQAVNRLVLARACAVVGALAAGFYLGYAVSWLGIDVELAHQRLVRSLVAAVAGALVVAASLLLERACRISDDDTDA
ncbi:DUF3180 domain-containing protein [Nocardioides sp. Kera G14]|uniref:DUF3180 domain-containing protein n=1 Tax=Nocardioides sp. Kera G14 TaxID=2884264 RepID=UPI001D102226|nr:DUF3180 domain-containing protein [Nocardioides sp. Kera G14]UDY23848.1 DUF3180 domain-containing protein [Nocardioides sp. Kera G14]